MLPSHTGIPRAAAPHLPLPGNKITIMSRHAAAQTQQHTPVITELKVSVLQAASEHSMCPR